MFPLDFPRVNRKITLPEPEEARAGRRRGAVIVARIGRDTSGAAVFTQYGRNHRGGRGTVGGRSIAVPTRPRASPCALFSPGTFSDALRTYNRLK
jgi:hypothetical protein